VVVTPRQERIDGNAFGAGREAREQAATRAAGPGMLVLLIDGLNLVRRVHAAVPGEEDSPDHAESVLESCTRSLARALSAHHPTHALCIMEGEGPSWRHALHPPYKAGRPPMPAALAALLVDVEAAFEARGVRTTRVAGYEADDVLASIAVRVAERGAEALLLSTDRSMLTLLRPGIRVYNHFEDRELDPEHVARRFGVTPGQLTTCLALMGDASQGIPGVRSVGQKTAARLIGEHGSLDAILAAAETMPGRTGEALRVGADDARLSLRLAALDTRVEVGLNLSSCRVGRTHD